MAFVEWEDRYSVHNETIDEHHRRLFEIVNMLHDAVWKKSGLKKLGVILEMLREFSEEHFSEEEAAMRRHGFPGHDEHCREHQLLLEGLAWMERRLKSADHSLGLDMLHFLLRDWLQIHILTHDKQYAPYFKNSPSLQGC